MAIIRKLEKIDFNVPGKHSEVAATYAIIEDSDGDKYLQIDTYGSETRQIQGKKSQSMRLSKESIAQLLQIIKNNF